MAEAAASAPTPACVGRRLLIDTNVWVDYYIDRSPGHQAARTLITSALRQDAVLYISTLSMKDVFFIIEQTLKRYARQELGELTDSSRAAATEIAWASLHNILETAISVPVSRNEALLAFTYRDRHNDFEDNLLLAAAQQAGVDYLVTADERLRRHSPVPALSPQAAIELLLGA